ncbi:hypothetical protein LTR47_008945 [Exophiala xenobiotica]|nr:hypothetical protein LTR47_008945 [Exophiala xenobiotica]KAK5244211.1 hypothetical protein LTS06_010164 [Exophiala xenobiotica]KAK5282622.1 hypothetical protein LTR40_003018 [Exophiala xenobiotica]KAK5347580.1 hypothetical protein LTR61_008851 [Exophiala xenobiotica]KAK5362673.1 hypothetical protein LTS03_009991 [Exophiala xenobiotica]
MLNGMVWAPKPAALPAIEIRPRPPRYVNRRPRSSTSGDGGSTPKGIRIDDGSDRHGLNQTITADEPPNPNTTASLQDQDPAIQPPKRPRASPASAHDSHSKKTHQCSTCPQTFARAEHLIRHERSHRKERPFSCHLCDSTFTRKDLIKRHISRAHPEAQNPNNVEDPRKSSQPGEAGQEGMSETNAANCSPSATARQTPGSSSELNNPNPTVEIEGHLPTENAMNDTDMRMRMASPQETFDLDALLHDIETNAPFSIQFPFQYDPNRASDGLSTHMLPEAQSVTSLGQRGPRFEPNVTSGRNIGATGLPDSRSTSNQRPTTSASLPQQTWRSMLSITEAKRSEIENDVKQVFSLVIRLQCSYDLY